VELAQDIGGQRVALGSGAQRGGQFQQRRERLVQGVAAGGVPLGAEGLDPGLGNGVLGPQGAPGVLISLAAGVSGVPCRVRVPSCRDTWWDQSPRP